MPSVFSRPEDAGASTSSSAPVTIDLRADYETIETNIVATSTKRVYMNKLISLMLFLFENKRNMLLDKLVPKMVVCLEKDLARPLPVQREKKGKLNVDQKKA